jgi:hypothetical protein
MFVKCLELSLAGGEHSGDRTITRAKAKDKHRGGAHLGKLRQEDP